MAIYITRRMRDMLIEHLDGEAVPIINNSVGKIDAVEAGFRRHTRRRLVERGLITERGGYTFITREGRSELAAALSDWATAIAAASGAIPELNITIPDVNL